MTLSLRKTLSLSLLLAVTAIMAAQLLVQHLAVLPRLNEQQNTIDKKDLERVKASTDTVFHALERVVYDNAVWQEMVLRMATGDEDFLERTYHDPDFFNVLKVDGIYYYDREGALTWGLTLDGKREPRAMPEMEKPAPLIREAVLIEPGEQAGRQRPVVKRDFFRLDGRPALFVSVAVMQPDQPETFQGTAAYWRFIDNGFVDELADTVRQPLQADMVRADDSTVPPGAAQASEIYQADTWVARHEGRLHLLYRDVRDEPFMVLSLEAHPSAFDQRLLGFGLVAGPAVALLAFILFYLYLNYSTINPILHLNRVIQGVTRTRDYSARTNIIKDDELGNLSARLDEMLATIQSQQQELSSHNLKLQRLSDSDELTGLFNRHYLESTTRLMRDNRKTQLEPLSLLLVDVDHFKQYNDHYGHSAGDKALRGVADVLQCNTHDATDLVARCGGEEFVLILNNTGEEGAVAVAQRIIAAMKEKAIPHAYSSAAAYLTISIGIAIKPPNTPFRYNELFDLADQALYRAKDEGRNRASVNRI